MLGLTHGDICRGGAIQFIIDIMTKTRSKKGRCDAVPRQGIRYASMRDSELLAVVKNRRSFLPLTQTQLAEQPQKHHLAVPSSAPIQTSHSLTLFAKLRQMLRWQRRRSEPELLEPLAPQHRLAPDSTTTIDGIRRSHAGVAHAGATEDQVNMAGTVPERVDKHGTKIEEIAGTGQHDSLGG